MAQITTKFANQAVKILLSLIDKRILLLVLMGATFSLDFTKKGNKNAGNMAKIIKVKAKS